LEIVFSLQAIENGRYILLMRILCCHLYTCLDESAVESHIQTSRKREKPQNSSARTLAVNDQDYWQIRCIYMWSEHIYLALEKIELSVLYQYFKSLTNTLS